MGVVFWRIKLRWLWAAEIAQCRVHLTRPHRASRSGLLRGFVSLWVQREGRSIATRSGWDPVTATRNRGAVAKIHGDAARRGGRQRQRWAVNCGRFGSTGRVQQRGRFGFNEGVHGTYVGGIPQEHQYSDRHRITKTTRLGGPLRRLHPQNKTTTTTMASLRLRRAQGRVRLPRISRRGRVDRASSRANAAAADFAMWPG